jgi:hypothetical protein
VLVVVSEGAIGVGLGKVRLELDGLVVVGDGAVVIALASVGETAIDVGAGEVLAALPSRYDDVGASANSWSRVSVSGARGPPACYETAPKSYYLPPRSRTATQISTFAGSNTP